MIELTPLKKVFYRKIQKKLTNNQILPPLTQSYTSRHKERKMLSPIKSRIDSNETQIFSTTKRLELDKIKLRLLKDRLGQKKNILNTFGIKSQKKIKEEKERQKNEYDFKKETYELNILIEENNKLKKEIINSRKKKLEMEKIKQKLIKQILDKKNKLNEIKKENELIGKDGNDIVLKEEINIFKKQQKKYEAIKNYL